MTHTPGPWHYRVIKPASLPKWSKWGCFAANGNNEDFLIAEMPYSATKGARIAEHQANARLIAAAPDMLAALETILEMDVNGHQLQDRLQFSDTGRAIYTQAHAAITRAKGG